MRFATTLLAAIAAATLTAAPASAGDSLWQLLQPEVRDRQPVARDVSNRGELVERQRDQDRAYDSTRQGLTLPLPLIERRIVPRMRGFQYLGPEMRGSNYRFKFVRDGRLVWVDVDPRTGRVVDTSNR